MLQDLLDDTCFRTKHLAKVLLVQSTPESLTQAGILCLYCMLVTDVASHLVRVPSVMSTQETLAFAHFSFSSLAKMSSIWRIRTPH